MFIRKKKYEDLKDNRDFWKKQFELIKEDKDSLIETNKKLEEDRDCYKEAATKEHKKYMKIMASNGGYATSAKTARKKLLIVSKELHDLKRALRTGVLNPKEMEFLIKETTTKRIKSSIKESNVEKVEQVNTKKKNKKVK